MKLSVFKQSSAAGVQNEAGKLTGETSMPDTKGSAPAMAIRSLSGCRFMPYRINGNATYYHGYVELLGR